MTDLEITKLCAEAMGGTLCITPDQVQRFSPNGTHPLTNAFVLNTYDPLHDDAQDEIAGGPDELEKMLAKHLAKGIRQ